MEKKAHLFTLRNTIAIFKVYENMRKAAKSVCASVEEWHQIKMKNLIKKKCLPPAIMKNKKIRIVIVYIYALSLSLLQYVCDGVHRGESD